ncbi:MAG: hypothetical protein GW778_05295 [Alphaproteobacteria bacterium]|nr:hypothetical protein [Alphaproteobacteria bacterium]
MQKLFLLIAGTIIAIAANTHTANASDTLKTLLNTDGNYEIIPGFIDTNATLSNKITDLQEHVTDKSVVMLKARENGDLKPYRLYLGARIVGTYIAERTNTAGKFPILSRLPPTHTKGTSDTYSVINDFTPHAIATLPWVTLFAQGEYTELAYTGQDRWKLRKYGVTIGDLDKFPLYAAIAKKSVNFGNFSSYGPFTHTHSAHYFWAQTDEPLLEVGYAKDGTMLAASLIKNDRGLRVLNSPKNDDKYENFALNASHRIEFNDDYNVKIGAGFLRGTIYDSSIAHHPPTTGTNDRSWNGAVNANIEAKLNKFDVMAEYTQTVEDWPATDSHVSALTLQGRYNDTILHLPTKYSLSYSQGIQGDSDEEWFDMQQGVAGVEITINPHLSIGAEYVASAGFVPLIVPKLAADNGVVSHTGIVGLKISF